jgi:hypothetical protein
MEYSRIFGGILLVPHNIVMDLDNVMNTVDDIVQNIIQLNKPVPFHK